MFVTSDIVAVAGDQLCFAGRRGQMIKVGGAFTNLVEIEHALAVRPLCSSWWTT